MRLMNLFATETDSDGAGHFNANDVCSVALLENRTVRMLICKWRGQAFGAVGLTTRISKKCLTERRWLRRVALALCAHSPSKTTVPVAETMAPTVKVRVLAMVTVPNGVGVPVPGSGKDLHWK